jgi:rubrerythrin
MADLSENIDEGKFSEMDGELVCNACGGMFDPTETSCPSCGTLKE